MAKNLKRKEQRADKEMAFSKSLPIGLGCQTRGIKTLLASFQRLKNCLGGLYIQGR
jgi:hypothetical protein